MFQTTIGGVVTQFLYDGDALVAEYNNNVLTRRYVHGDQVDEPWVEYGSSIIGVGNRTYLHADHQGSIIARTDGTGNYLGKLTFDSFGIPDSNNVGRFGYTGQIWFKELGLFHYKARMYSPKLGRFLQTDPIFYADDMNMYAYVGNDPVNKIDPSGMNTLSPYTMSQVDANMREIRKTMDPGEFDMRMIKMTVGSLGMLASGGALAFAAGALTFADGASGGSVVSTTLQKFGADTSIADGAASVVDLTLGGKGIADGLGDISKTFIFGKDAMELVPQVGMLVTDTSLTQYELKGNVENVMNGVGLPQFNGNKSTNSDQGMSSGNVRICSGMGAEKGGCN